jgi:putative ABC transport system permease protein
VIWLAVRGVLTRPAQSLVLAVGLVLTLLGLAGLSSSAHTTSISLKGDLASAWDTPFDLLVRPAGSTEPLERESGLIRPNYLSGIHGGITELDLAQVREIPGVSLAAPLAAVGAVNWPSAFQLRLPRSDSHAVTVYRVRSTVTGQAGLSTYPVDTRYIVVAPRGRLSMPSGVLTVPGRDSTLLCGYPVNCFAGTVCFDDSCTAGQYPSSEDPSFYLPLLQPIQVAGIDPVAEAKLTGLGDCLTTGRMLAEGDRPTPTDDPEPAEIVPAMASDDAFLDQVLYVDVASAALGGDDDPTSVRGWTSTERRRVTLQALYRTYLSTSIHDYVDPWPIWSAGDVRYTRAGTDHLVAHSVPPDRDIYRRVNTFQEIGIADSVLIPPEVDDPWFRSVTEHRDTQPPFEGSTYRSKIWNVLGRYNPSCLPGFSALSGASMEAYATPDVRTADGRKITPSRSLGDYVASPPLLLTTLSGARWLADPSRYEGQPGSAFISVVRVRVADTGEPSEASQARLAAVAEAIHDRTGLQVDIVKGSSTREIMVDLPAGEYGRPALTVRERWSVKGVAVTFLRAIDAQDRALLLLLMVSAGLLVAQASYIAVRQRRRQLARLRALGWSRLRLAALVELETAAVGLAAGLLATAGAVPILALGHVPVSAAVAVPPIGLVISGLAALPAAWAAMRHSPVAAMGDVQPIRPSRPPATTVGLALRELRRSWPIETAVACSAVALGATLVGLVVLVAAGFRSQLDTTVLGVALNTHVRPFHVVLAGLSLALGGCAAAEVVLLAWLSRRPQLAVLKALGWSGRRLAGVVCWQAGVVGLGGAVASVPAVLVSASLLSAPASATALAAAATATGCVGATLLAAAGPCVLALRASARQLLTA